MTTAKKIKEIISAFPDDFVFEASDLECDEGQRQAASRALQRMAVKGEIRKLYNGKYFKPRMTVFGALRPSPIQVIKDFLVRDGQTIGYLTGATAFSQYSLTTQISSEIQIGTNEYRRPIKRGIYKITFVLQPNLISEADIDLLRFLDCLRFIKHIPATTPNEACQRIIRIVKRMNDDVLLRLSQYALKYPPYVRALIGAILDNVGCSESVTDLLKKSLNGISKYRLPISLTILPNRLKWRIYEPA